MRKRDLLKSPVRENRTPGSVRGQWSNPLSYRDYEIDAPLFRRAIANRKEVIILIYEIDTLRRLDPPNIDFKRKGNTPFAFWLAVLLVPVFLIMTFIVLIIIGVQWLFFRPKSKLDKQNMEVYKEENIKVTSDYNDETQTLVFVMNYDAFIKFLLQMNRLIEERSNYKMYGFPYRKFNDSDAGYHIHSDFIFPDLDYELTIGISNNELFKLDKGDSIWASSSTWKKAVNLWWEVVKERRPKAIVLDNSLTEWCTPDSTGRFILMYEP